MARVSLIILNRDGEDLLDDCLGSLKLQTFSDFELIFVDNGSSDGSLDRVHRLMPAARCIALEENTGFARGNNLAIAQARGEYVVLLNNDTQLDERFLEELVRPPDRDARVGMVAPKILNFYERDLIDSVGGLIVCRDGLAQGRGRGERDRGQYDDLQEVLLPSGCAALYRREMLDEIGLLDESFFMYCEDTDLGLRARWAGWKAVAAPAAVVYHKYSVGAGAYSPFKMYFVERNHFLVALKNLPLWQLLQLPIWSAYRYFLMASAVASGKGKGGAGNTGALLWAFLRGHAAALLRSPGALLERPRTASCGSGEMARLLAQHRLGLRHMIFNA
jgi:GT2 family glycosyltransferase